MSVIKLENITKVYENSEVKAVDNFSLEIKENEFVVLLGPSGCGKSTLLRMIAGLEEITEGKLYIRNELSNRKAAVDRNVSMVFQNYALYGNMPVYQNIGFSLILKKSSDEEIYNTVMRNKDVIEITENELKRLPAQLSGGQRQRVALGRAITKDTEILLMDEPLSNLDAKLRGIMRKEITKIVNELNRTIVYVTHDQLEAMTMASKIVVMDKGKIQQVGAPLELYNRPQNLFVARFIGNIPMNLIEGKYDKEKKVFIDKHNKIIIDFSKYIIDEKYHNKDVMLGFRAEFVEITKPKQCDIKVVVDYFEFLGNYQIVYSNYLDNKITIKNNLFDDIKYSEEIGVKVDNERILLFDLETGDLINYEK